MLELIVVILVLGLLAGVSGLAIASLTAPRESETTRLLRTARMQAIRTGRPVSVRVPHATRVVLLLPDGRSVGQGLDPLTGVPNDSTR